MVEGQNPVGMSGSIRLQDDTITKHKSQNNRNKYHNHKLLKSKQSRSIVTAIAKLEHIRISIIIYTENTRQCQLREIKLKSLDSYKALETTCSFQSRSLLFWFKAMFLIKW